jgi:hypothetical protein
MGAVISSAAVQLTGFDPELTCKWETVPKSEIGIDLRPRLPTNADQGSADPQGARESRSGADIGAADHLNLKCHMNM